MVPNWLYGRRKCITSPGSSRRVLRSLRWIWDEARLELAVGLVQTLQRTRLCPNGFICLSDTSWSTRAFPSSINQRETWDPIKSWGWGWGSKQEKQEASSLFARGTCGRGIFLWYSLSLGWRWSVNTSPILDEETQDAQATGRWGWAYTSEHSRSS